MKTMTRAAVGAFAIAAVTVGPVAAAHADPSNLDALPITVTCDNGVSYHAVTNGNGNWTPAHDLNSQSVVVPVEFGTQTFSVYDADGNLIDQEIQGPSAKPGALAGNKHATLLCDFGGAVDGPDGMKFVLSGSVLGFMTPSGQ